MATSWSSWDWQVGLVSFVAISGVITSFGDCVHAQITPDGTLGAESSIVIPNADGVYVIQGGATRGTNLFHSFEEFSVPTGGTAYFNNAADIQNIISRVTGGSISNIDGLIRANGTANLFLINPNGIIFGPNASLNIGGSFLASTASSLNFADGTQFSATARPTTPLLTVSVPLGLQFGGNAGRIIVQGNGQGLRTTSELIDTTAGLRVQPNQTLALVGGDVALEGGTLKTAGGRIELGSVAGSALVSLSPIDSGWALGYSAVPTFGDIQLSQQAAVDASGEGGGDIQVRGRQVTLTDGSQIEASTLGAEPGGALTVTASESVELIGRTAFGQFTSGLYASVGQGATGNGGNLTVETRRLILRDGAQVFTSTAGSGPSGTLAVIASESVELIGGSAYSQFPTSLSNLVGPRATGSGGNLTLETRRLSVRDGAAVSVATFGEGQGGTLSVRAEEFVKLIGTSVNGTPRSLSARTRGAGNAGNLIIETGELTVQNGAGVSVSSERLGNGNAGNLKVTARSIRLNSTGKITAETASGQGGKIALQAHDLLLMRNNSSISTTAGTAGAGGDGGDIAINTDTLVALENSDITANAFEGRGGNIRINTQGIFRSPDSDITATGGSRELNGTVEINTLDTEPSRALVTLPTEPVNATGLIAQDCPAGAGSTASKFVITGTGGIPRSPSDPLKSYAVWHDLPPSQVADNSMSPATEQANGEPAQIVEAQGWRQSPDGTITLTAEPSGVVPYSTLNATPSSCHAQPSFSRVPSSTNVAE